MNLSKYKDTLKIINNMFKNNRLSHAYLICGEEGTPKKDFAYYIAMKFYCNDVCMKCPNCNQILNNIHPNVCYIESDGQNIKKEQITDLIHNFSRSSLVEGPRIYIISDVEKMNKYSANSLLKFIEEPTNNIYAILTTSNIEAVLPTIKSRCQQISLKSNVQLDLDIDEENKRILSSITKSKEDAIAIFESPSYDIVVDVVKKIYYVPKNERITFIREYYDYFKNKDTVELFIKVSMLFLNDVALYNHSIKTKIFEIKDNKIDPYNLLKLITSLQTKIRFNVNISLAFECYLLEGE